MHALDDQPLARDALNGLAALDGTAPGLLLILLKLLALGTLWAVYLAKRRRNRALRASIAALTARLRASPRSHHTAAPSPSPRRRQVGPARR